MRINKIGLIILSGFFILAQGCAQQSSRTSNHFYLLNSNSQAISKNNSTHILGIRPVTVANYINNSGIALQTSSNKIVIANHHLWAEQPSLAVTRVLHSELNTLLTQSRVDNGQFGSRDDWQYILTTHVDQFHGTENGQAILSGYWQLESKNSVIVNQRFNLSAPIDEPGYASLVNQLQQLLSQLALKQAEQISIKTDQE